MILTFIVVNELKTKFRVWIVLRSVKKMVWSQLYTPSTRYNNSGRTRVTWASNSYRILRSRQSPPRASHRLFVISSYLGVTKMFVSVWVSDCAIIAVATKRLVSFELNFTHLFLGSKFQLTFQGQSPILEITGWLWIA